MTARSSRLEHALLLLATLGSAAGCPVLLSDGFDDVPRGSGPVDGSATVEAEAPGRSGPSPDASTGGALGAAPGPETGGPDAAAEPGGCGQCAAEETCCDGSCVDLRDDPRHCRACGHGCPGTLCSNATCTNTCAFGFIDCNHNVVDGCEVNAATDPAGCGNCGISCAFDQRCVQGRCICSDHTSDCDGAASNGCETDTSSDPSSCGACGRSCGANEICVAGSCACAAGFEDCNADSNDGCEASLATSNSCGSCATDCGRASLCLAQGACGCQPEYLDCDDAVLGCETPVNDAEHCGSCGTSCPPTAPVCNGSSCVVGCGALTLCGSSCVDTDRDPGNCGGCGTAVGPHQICVGGRPGCAAGFADCDAARTDCEVDVRTSAVHCGACNQACKPGAVCSGGACACAPSTPRDCGGACRQCCSVAHCSDGDACTADTCLNGVCSFGGECAAGGRCCAGQGCFECCGDGECATGEVCTNHACLALTCAAPLIPCAGRCVDTGTDPDHCNGCGNACGPGRSCVAAECTPKWVAMSQPPAAFVAREKAAYTGFSTKAFVWGGADANGKDLASGAVYDASTNDWVEVPVDAQTPSPRVLSTAVWTGAQIVVWGGGDAAGTVDHADGARYDPGASAWTRMSTSGAPGGRRAPHAVWTGSRVLFWGGQDKAGKALQGGHLYDPSNDTWSGTRGKDQPPATLDATVGWSGSLFVMYGGRPDGSGQTQHTYLYDPSADLWRHGHDGPSARFGAMGTWDGSALIAWSGSVMKNDGKRYQPSSDNWSSVSTEGTPLPRFASHRETGWSARASAAVTLVLGGYGGSTTGPAPLTDGGLYNATTNTWATVPKWPSGTSHLWGVGVLSGTEFVLWSGRADAGGPLTTAGEQFRP